MLPRREHSALALIFGTLLALIAPAAYAEDPALEATGDALSTTLGNHRVTFPVPLWTGEGQGESAFVFQKLDADVEALLFVPPDQSIVSWSQMMGVLVVDRAGYPASAHVASLVQPMTASCTTGQMGMTPVKSQKAGQTEALILVCGRYRSVGSSSPKGCAAGIVVAVVRESWNGAMKVYDEWCTGAFNVDDRASWPVAPDELVRIAVDMQLATSFEALPG